MRIAHRFVLLPVVVLLSAPQDAAAARAGRGEPVRLLGEVRGAVLATNRAVTVSDVEIRMGLATLMMEEGVLVPANPVDGRTFEIVFVGDASFDFSPADPVEQHQLEVFAGESPLFASVSHAVLVTGDEYLFSKVLAGDQASGLPAREAVKFFEAWVKGPERQGFAADLSMIKALLGDPLYRGFFAIWARSPDHGDFYYVVDPSASEQVTLGQFVPADMSGMDVWEQRQYKNFISRYKFFGRFADFSIENLGYWDTWVSTTFPAPERGQGSGIAAPEPEHYVIDLYVNPALELDAKGSAKIRMRAGPAGANSVAYWLYPGMRVKAVSGAGGEPLDFIRREGALHVFLGEPARSGETFEVRVDYEGDLVEPTGKDSWALLETVAWFPRTGSVNRATYDVTLRRPKRFDLVASGQAIESGEKDGVAWERRMLDLPAFGFSFELGYLALFRDRVGHVELTFAFPRGGSGPDEAERKAIVEAVKSCLPAYEEKFGAYPLDYLTVATVYRGFSQGLLSFVTLAETELRDLEGTTSEHSRRWKEEKRSLLIAHEISHQWWGNWVGWASYRDQWLSEALAEHSALQYGAGSAESKAAFLSDHARSWRRSLARSTRGRRTVASLGSVTLGARLYSSKASGAYQAIVYHKGAVILRMLSWLFGDDHFERMLGELARAVANRTIDTPTFIKAIERMSGSDLEAFAQQFVYGTGIPDVYYEYAVEPSGGAWKIRGEATQVGRGNESLRIVRQQSGGWRVDRRREAEVDVTASTLVVPFQIILTPPEESRTKDAWETRSARGLGGRLRLEGRRTPFEISVPEKPERLVLDQLGEVLALFHDAGWTPKQSLFFQARDLGWSGDLGGAMSLLRQALESPAYSELALAWMDPNRREHLDVDEEGRLQDARVRTLMARLLLDQEDVAGAEVEIAAAEALLEKPDEEGDWDERAILRARIDLSRGKPKAAYDRLGKGLRSWWLDAEGYALLAIAASEAGHDQVARMAIRRAESLGVDVRDLREARNPTHE